MSERNAPSVRTAWSISPQVIKQLILKHKKFVRVFAKIILIGLFSNHPAPLFGHSVGMRPNFQAILWFECYGLDNDELLLLN
jgi:hypothetical protein